MSTCCTRTAIVVEYPKTTVVSTVAVGTERESRFGETSGRFDPSARSGDFMVSFPSESSESNIEPGETVWVIIVSRVEGYRMSLPKSESESADTMVERGEDNWWKL